MGNRDRSRTTRRHTEWFRFLRHEKARHRAIKQGFRWPRDRHFGAFGWPPTDERING